MPAAEIVSQITERQRRDPEALWWPNKSDVLEWVSDDLEVVGPLFDQIAVTLARGYERGDLSFELCDGIVNGMYATFLELPLNQMPPLFYDVFLAFDAGEYPHMEDDPAVDPVAKYTDPQIRDLVRSLTV